MLFRGKQPEASIWRRFRASSDGFTFSEDNGYYTAHVVANAERVDDLFHALTEHLPPAVDVALEDVRSGLSWKGENIALPDVREVIARMKSPLSTFGGVEFAVYTSEDQLTLNPHLELFIYARTDQWFYILQGKGLEERRMVRTRSWRLRRSEFATAPDLVQAVATAAERLALTEA
jgi:hypothetical protein